jgi:hypothetical protein
MSSRGRRSGVPKKTRINVGEEEENVEEIIDEETYKKKI